MNDIRTVLNNMGFLSIEGIINDKMMESERRFDSIWSICFAGVFLLAHVVIFIMCGFYGYGIN